MKILHAHGQTCNKFFTYINYLADSLESGETIVILSPDVTLRHYPALKNAEILKFPFYSEFFAKNIGYNRLIKWLDRCFANRYSLKFLSLFSKIIPFTNFIEATTGSYSSPNRIKYHATLKALFTPDPTLTKKVESIFRKEREDHDVICGVHIRYGDYRTWQGGRYYYSPQQYHLLMLNVLKLFHGQSVAFFISCNENLDLSVFPGCNCFTIPESNSTEDLYGLSNCDLMMGPPSTFSGWASYYADKLLYFIEDPNAEIKTSSFKKITEIWGKKQ